MPDHLQEAIRRLGGGYKMNRQNFKDVAKLLTMSMQSELRYPGGDKTTRTLRLVQLTEALKMTMLRNSCIRQVRAWATITPVLQTTSLSTPQTVLELANMLRNTDGNLRCPFGDDFEQQLRTGTRMDSSHRLPFWLALVELYSDGYRYDGHSDKNLPSVLERVVDVVVNKRQERSQGDPEHLIGVCGDLARFHDQFSF